MSSRKQFIVFFLLLLALRYIDGRKLGLRAKHKYLDSIQTKQEISSLPQTWVEACVFDIEKVDQSCQIISEAKARYEKLLSDFLVISKPNIDDSRKVLLKVKALIDVIGEKLEKNTSVVSFAEVQEKEFTKDIHSLNSNKDLRNIALAKRQEDLLDAFALLEKQDSSLITMTKTIKSSLDALIKLCQNFLDNYDSYLANLTNKKKTLEEMMENSKSGLCPSGALCKQGGCVSNDAESSGKQTATESPFQPDYSGKYHIRVNWSRYICASDDGNLRATFIIKQRCTYYKISFKRKNSNKNIYCINSSLKDIYIRVGKEANQYLEVSKTSCDESSEFYIDEDVLYGEKVFKITSVLWGGQVTVRDSNLILSENKNTESQMFTFEPMADFVEGKYYYLSSEWGGYLDMNVISDTKKIVRTQMEFNINILNKDRFLVTFIAHNEYYLIKSKQGGYLYLRRDTNISLTEAYSVTEDYKNSNPMDLDGYLFKLVDRGDGFYEIESHRNGSLLYMDSGNATAFAVSKDYNKNSRSFVFDLLPESEKYFNKIFSGKYSIKTVLDSYICAGVGEEEGKTLTALEAYPRENTYQEEFYINEETTFEEKFVYFTSVMWGTIVSTQEDRTLTANKNNTDPTGKFRLDTNLISSYSPENLE